MKKIDMQKVIITLGFALMAYFGVNALEAVAATSATGYVGAWYGNSATNSTVSANSDGQFGVIKNPSGSTMTNKPTGTGNPPSSTTGFYNTGSITANSTSYSSNSGETSNTFTISPNRTGSPKYRIKFIKYMRSDAAGWTDQTPNMSAAESKTDYTITLGPLVKVTRTGSKGSYVYSAAGYTYYIWAGFEEDTTEFTLTGSIDTSNNTVCDTDPATKIVPKSTLIVGKYTTWPTLVSGVNTSSITATSTGADPTPTTVFTLNTNDTICEIAAVKYDGDPAGNTTGLSGSEPFLNGTTYTKDLDKSTTFKVLFRKLTVKITTTVDSTSPVACTSGSFKISPSGGRFEKGKDQSFSIISNPGCQIESVKVTDAASDRAYSNTEVFPGGTGYVNGTDSLSGTYTFKNIQSDGAITVKFGLAPPPADKAYCQLPPFMLTNAVLLPNVLIIFDRSMSMKEYPYTGYNCNSGHKAADLGPVCAEYMGYFDSKTMYTRSGSSGSYVYTPAASGTTLNLSTSALSGNYLNYTQMQKIDIIRKILVGGKVGAYGVARGVTGTKYLKLNNGNSVYYGPDDPTGVIHHQYNPDGSATVRLGLMVFTEDRSGEVTAPFGTAKEDLIDQIENSTDPTTSTPLAGSLYEAMHYFKGDTSPFTGVNYSDTTKFPIDTDFTRHAIQASCQKNFVIVITDGKCRGDQTSVPVGTSTLATSFDSWWTDSLTPKPVQGDCDDSGTDLMSRVAYYAHTHDLLTLAEATPGTSTNKVGLNTLKNNLNVFIVYTLDKTDGALVNLQQAVKFGSFDEAEKRSATNKTNYSGKPDVIEEFGTGTVALPTKYNNFISAKEPAELESGIEKMLSDITALSASGTAAAVANNKSGERGANMLQALFYPDMNGVKWLGEVQALWYYLDPVIGYSGIYQDSDSDSKLNLAKDQLISSDPLLVKALWRAGSALHIRDYTDRKIYTFLDSTNKDLTATSNVFSLTNTLRKNMNLGLASETGALTDTEVTEYINYIKGADNKLRNRKVTYTDPSTAVTTTNKVWKLGDIVNSTPIVQSSVPINAYNTAYSDLTYDSYIKSTAYKNKNVVYTGSNDGLFHAFRLGKVKSINDSANPLLIAEMATDNDRGKEEWAYIPGNALPYITNQAGAGYCHQCLVDGAPTVVDASIYCASGDYWNCERTASSWQSVVVSSMGLGGASRDKDSSCNETYNPDLVASNNKDCVKAPATPAGLTSYTSGLSSYFALNVTDPIAPKFMWEFSDAQIPAANKAYNHNGTTPVASSVGAKGLGFTTPTAAIIRINAVDGSTPPKVVKKNNGRWFAVMASGPTGSITSSLTFTGHSDQNLKIYVVDLNGGSTFTQCTSAGATGCNYWVMDTGIPFAFANSLNGAAMDLDRSSPTKNGNYSDDVVYITYTKADVKDYVSPYLTDKKYPVSDTAWNKGGVIRLVTNHNPDPFTWFTSKLIDDIGPITTSIGRIQDKANKKLWVYFGEGRSFYPGDETSVKDSSSNYVARSFYGVADPCYTQYGEVVPGTVSSDNSDSNFALGKTPATCPAVVKTDLQNQDTPATDAAALLTASTKGWYVNMAVPSGTAGAERVVSDVTAAFNGTIFFTTYSPNSDPCTAGGSTSIWAVKYNTGGTPSAETMKGKAPVQTSSGGIKLIDLATAFTEKDGRKLNAALAPTGMAPKGKFPPLLSPKAAKRIISIQEQ